MKDSMYLRPTIVALIVTAFVLFGCNNGSNKQVSTEPDDKPVDTTITKETTTPGPISLQRSTLLFDKSLSMRGYMETSDSRFYGAISSVINIASVDSCHFYGEKEEKGIDKESFNNLINKRGIKWSGESNIKSMIESMIQHINTGDDICLLVTDGILSGSNDDITHSPNRGYNITHRIDLTNSIKAMFEKQAGNMSALVIRYKAKFKTSAKILNKDGWYYYCYNNDKKIIIDQDRPYYIIAIGKTDKVKFFESKLKESERPDQLVSTPSEQMVLIGDDFADYGCVKLSYKRGVERDKGNDIYKIKSEYNNADSMVCFTTDISCLPEYMRKEDYFEKNVELLVRFGLNNAEKQPMALDTKFRSMTVVEKNGNSTLQLYLSASQLQNSELTFRLKYALPKWVENKSSDDDLKIDSDPLEMDRTFNLKYLIAGFSALQQEKCIQEQKLKFQ